MQSENLSKINEYYCALPGDMTRLGVQIGSQLSDSSVVCFFGGLGAGKTTFIKGLASGYANISSKEVVSPTFNLLNIYKGSKTIYHFDLYRMKGAEDFIGMGFDEYLSSEGLCCIEWSERIQSLIPMDSFIVNIGFKGLHGRQIVISKKV